MGWIGKLFGVKEKVQPTHVDDESFRREVLESDLPVLLDVWTPTCTHCDKLVPIVLNLASRYTGRLKVAEINGAEAPAVMASLGIRGTPTVIYFADGREVERVVGFRGSLYHIDFIENELLPGLAPAENDDNAPPFA
jgi:thioredoxin 1